MVEAVATEVAEEASTAAVALVAETSTAVGFPAAATMGAEAMRAALTAAATAEDPVTLAGPIAECAARPVPTMLGHPKVAAAADSPEPPISTPPLPMASSIRSEARAVPLSRAPDSQATASTVPHSLAVTGADSAMGAAGDIPATAGVVGDGAGALVGVDGVGAGLTGAGPPTGIPIGTGLSTDTSGNVGMMRHPERSRFSGEARDLPKITVGGGWKDRPAILSEYLYPRTLPSNTLSMSRVVPTYAATAIRAPRETSETGSSVSGSTISK